ncbi:MAG: hypothetical protein KA218_07425 [Arenimonas sp.]|nr:hypothetical protein [Arenimonas sp.]
MTAILTLVFIGGILGGLAAGFFFSKLSLGGLGNALVGMAGGALFAHLQLALGFSRADDMQDLGVIVLRLTVGLVGGFLLTALVGQVIKRRA